MTMQRGSMIFAAEGYFDNGLSDETPNKKSHFGKGRGYYHLKKRKDDGTYESVRCPWIAAPTGTFIGTSHDRTASTIRAMGTKRWDTVMYGTFTGSFNWSFTLDYKYLHALMLIFEDYTCDTADGGDYVRHRFRKVDNRRIRSFTIRRVILNEIAGGPEDSDEVMQLFGCVIRNVTFSQAAGGSQIDVSITGLYVSEQMYKGHLDATDYVRNDGQLTEYLCMLIGDKPHSEINECSYVANTDQLSLDIENGADKILNTCSPYAGEYLEGLSTYKLTTSIYSNNPEVYKQRVYGGGQQVLPNETTHILMPKVKGLKPLGTVKMISYTGTGLTSPGESIDMDNIIDTFKKSDKSLEISVEDVVLKSMTWQKSSGQKITDNISSAECNYATLTFVIKTKDDGKPINQDVLTFDICNDPKDYDKLKKTVNPREGPDW